MAKPKLTLEKMEGAVVHTVGFLLTSASVVAPLASVLFKGKPEAIAAIKVLSAVYEKSKNKKEIIK